MTEMTQEVTSLVSGLNLKILLQPASLVGAPGAGEQVHLHHGRQRQLQTNAGALKVWMAASYNFPSTGLSPTNATSPTLQKNTTGGGGPKNMR